ncbi:MAG: carboxypeptidase regulatory-like domain-containing protein [Acidobacteriota bacterium]|nr:carboxypeptidase regulatory-like domain-containing protein [Acidobacteriota bacterium]
MSQIIRQTIFLTALAFGTAMSFSTDAKAATYTVDTTADNAALTTCNSVTDNDCSLRGAISRANATTANDTINFTFGARDPGCDFGCTIVLTGGNLTVNSTTTAGSLTITNSTENSVSISGNNASRVFFVNSGANLSLVRLIVMNGSAAGSTAAGKRGGGIYNSGTLTLNVVTVSGNAAQSDGGGIYSESGGNVTLANSTVSGNTAQGLGGGISSIGTLTLTNSTVNGNSSAGGGGIYLSSGGATLMNSTINGNTAGGEAGGIYVSNSSGIPSTVTVTNSTVSGNIGRFSGGITNYGNSTLNLSSVTLTENRQLDDSTYCLHDGIFCSGGISNSGTANLKNTIVAGNFTSFINEKDDFAGAISSNSSYNIIGNNFGMTGITNGANGNQTGTPQNPIDPRLAPLAFNGGATQTHALMLDSPALDKGSSFGASEDQRGAARPVDIGNFPNSSDATDIGAFEMQLPTAASVSISGRVITQNGRGLANAPVILTSNDGSTRYARTSTGGHYHFSDVPAGSSVVITVISKRYNFAPQVLTVTEETVNLDLFAQE